MNYRFLILRLSLKTNDLKNRHPKLMLRNIQSFLIRFLITSTLQNIASSFHQSSIMIRLMHQSTILVPPLHFLHYTGISHVVIWKTPSFWKESHLLRLKTSSIKKTERERLAYITLELK